MARAIKSITSQDSIFAFTPPAATSGRLPATLQDWLDDDGDTEKAIGGNWFELPELQPLASARAPKVAGQPPGGPNQAGRVSSPLDDQDWFTK